MRIHFYQVGGSVRDELLGVKPSDYDYAVEVDHLPVGVTPFDAMYEAVKMKVGAKGIYFVEPKYSRLKARSFPEMSVHGGFNRDVACDYVLCRRGTFYDPTAQWEGVEGATILEDLACRDFTVNAMAKAEDGTIIDPYNAMKDLKGRMLRCVGTAKERFTEDGVRLLRALRLNVTRGLILDAPIVECLTRPTFWEPRLTGVPIEMIRTELLKCFRHDTAKTLATLDLFRVLRVWLFTPRDGSRLVWLEPTLRDK